MADIDAGLNDFEQTYADTLAAFQKDAAEMIGRWIRQGKLSASDLTDIETITEFPGRNELKAELLRLLHGMSRFGQQQVGQELAKQNES